VVVLFSGGVGVATQAMLSCDDVGHHATQKYTGLANAVSQGVENRRVLLGNRRCGQHQSVVSARSLHNRDLDVYAHSNEAQGNGMEGCSEAEDAAYITFCGTYLVSILRRHSDGREPKSMED
jgi:hypothetical protein